ncbi:hypothetical protein AVEN_130583-1 [Araneus ventricosus]|uniref:Uncharacterized protein n=1 Tax=Araneus ventricosus TaxID=182803 RepID=A0A4Y2HIG2_ARAVE|nr:hypothetical protein AVEN_130583-1 [Araneus ventricosus]
MSHSTDMVVKPTICSLGLGGSQIRFGQFQCRKLLLLAATVIGRVRKILNATELNGIMQDKGRGVPKPNGRYLQFSGVPFFFPLWRQESGASSNWPVCPGFGPPQYRSVLHQTVHVTLIHHLWQ